MYLLWMLGKTFSFPIPGTEKQGRRNMLTKNTSDGGIYVMDEN